MADYEDTKVNDLVINNMSQEKFEELKAAGELDPTQIYLTPTEESGGGASGDFLPLSGGTMTGTITSNVTVNEYIAHYSKSILDGFFVGEDDVASGGFGLYARQSGNGLLIGAPYGVSGTTYGVELAISGRNTYLAPTVFGAYVNLGTSSSRWKTIYVTQIAYRSNIISVPDKAGTMALVEDIQAIVAVLPTEANGYTTVKNYGNGYVEITGYTAIGTVGASTGSEVQIDLPAGYTMANANYWVNIAPTSETTMFDFKAEAKARSTTHFMVAYKNEDETTGLTAAGVYWEVRGMLATE